MYYKFTEISDWEGEVWNFYVKLTTEEKELLGKVTELNDSFLLDLERQYTEKEVDLLCEKSDSGYMNFHNKVKKMRLLGKEVNEDFINYNFYKGGCFELY